MATEFEQAMPSYRLAQTLFGDDLQEVARRELGDENRWVEILWLNSLSYPYLTDDPALVTETVLLNGSLIRIPAPSGIYSPNKVDYDQVFERDCKMVNRRLTVENGDIAVVAGIENLKQQLNHRVRTPTGHVHRHPEYGCGIFKLHGRVQGPIKTVLAANYLKSSLKADYRVASVDSATVTVNGDAMLGVAYLETIAGGKIDIKATL